MHTNRFCTRLFLLTALLLPATADGQATFAGIPWGSTVATIKTEMARAEFEFQKVDEDGDLVFDGTLLDNDARAFAVLADGKLVKIVVNLVTADEDARPVYQQLRETLLAKYGAADYDYETFIDPYFDGDGFEEQAIRLEKAMFLVGWGDIGEDNHHAATITKQLTVVAEYVGPGWARERDRRNRTPSSIF